MLNYFSKIQNFESNNTLDALNMYNKAVVFSPNTDDNLARACADRASCLLRLGDYARALADIEQAQQAVDEYQFERRFELDERKGLAYLGLGRLAEAAAAFTTAISLLEDGAGFLQRKFVERKMGELQDSLRASSGAAHNNGVSNCEVSSKFQSMKRLPELRGRNPRYPALTDKVDVGMTSTSSLFRGATARGGSPSAIVANAEIAAGEIIGMEQPIASYLEKEFVKTNCWHCLVTVKERMEFVKCTQFNWGSQSTLAKSSTSTL